MIGWAGFMPARARRLASAHRSSKHSSFHASAAPRMAPVQLTPVLGSVQFSACRLGEMGPGSTCTADCLWPVGLCVRYRDPQGCQLLSQTAFTGAQTLQFEVWLHLGQEGNDHKHLVRPHSVGVHDVMADQIVTHKAVDACLGCVQLRLQCASDTAPTIKDLMILPLTWPPACITGR